jgi:hypothetical protein
MDLLSLTGSGEKLLSDKVVQLTSSVHFRRVSPVYRVNCGIYRQVGQEWDLQIVIKSTGVLSNGRTFIFDGGLPARKRDEREKRYQSLLSDAIRQSTGKAKKYIPPPFVVLVCQQTLLQLSRKYNFKVQVVPGEADDFVVRLSREEKNSYIVSADGDFLVYVGETGTFVSLQMFPWRWDGTLVFTAYTNVREALGITRANGMIELAALLIERVDRTVPQLIQCINKSQTLDCLSRDRLQGYIAAYTAIEILSVSSESLQYFESGVLPGRVTELFCGDERPTFWLPLLPITTPLRKDPWPISRYIRQAAYSQFQRKGLLHGDTVIEMIRRGERIVPEPVDIAERDIHISNDRESVFITAMKLLVENVTDEDLRYLPFFVGMYILLGQPSSPSAFTVMSPALQYVTIQYQSIIYSLIILLQSKYPISIEVPAFACLWDSGRFKTAMTQTNSAKGDNTWSKITEGMGQGYPLISDRTSSSDQRSAKKAKKSKSTVPTGSDPQRNSSNPFSVLSVSNSTAP